MLSMAVFGIRDFKLCELKPPQSRSGQSRYEAKRPRGSNGAFPTVTSAHM